MRLDTLELYLSSIIPRISTELNASLEFSEENNSFGIVDKERDVEVYIFAGEIEILKLPPERLDLLGIYTYKDDYDFIRVFAICLGLIYNVKVLNLIDLLVFKKSRDWRDFAGYIVGLEEMESDITERGIYIQEIGELTEENGNLYLASVDLFEFSFEPNDHQSFREGVLGLLSSLRPTYDLLDRLVEATTGLTLPGVSDEATDDTSGGSEGDMGAAAPTPEAEATAAPEGEEA